MTDYEEPQEDWAGFSGAQTDLEDQSLHPATLISLERKLLPSIYSKREDGKDWAIIWTFALEDIEGQTVDATSSESTGPRSKALPMLEALLGKAQAKEMLKTRIDRQSLIGRPCQVLIAINDNGFPKVASVLPVNAARRAAPQAEVAPDTIPLPPEPQGPSEAPSEDCESFSPEFGRCVRDGGHGGLHRNKDRETWA
jgi:hypothetical protein